jgi:hypothetical protein
MVMRVLPSDDLDVVFRSRVEYKCDDHVFEGCNDVKVCFNASFRSQKERKRGVGKRRKRSAFGKCAECLDNASTPLYMWGLLRFEVGWSDGSIRVPG